MSKERKTAGLDADDITASPKVTIPGKIPKTGPVTDKDPTGDDYIDHGAVCDDKEGANGCFLNGRQRSRLISQFQQRIIEASTNYKIAAQALRVDELVKEEQELPLVAYILLDLVTLHSVMSISHSLAHLKGGSLESLSDIAKEAKQTGTHHDNRWYEHVAAALGGINDEHIKDNIENAIDGVKERARKTLQSTNNYGDTGKKAETASFLDMLTDQTGLGYAMIRERTPGTANDGELVTLWNAFDAKNHTVAAYKEALAAKLDRFKQSGVMQIAHTRANPKTWDASADTDMENRHPDEGGYVIWNQYLSGHPKELIYEHGGHSFSAKEQVEKHQPAGRFGGQSGLPRGSALTVVPAEFREMAIMKHERVWGVVGTQIIDDSDPLIFGPDRAKQAQDNKNKHRPTVKNPITGQITLGTGPMTTTPLQPFNAPGGDHDDA